MATRLYSNSGTALPSEPAFENNRYMFIQVVKLCFSVVKQKPAQRPCFYCICKKKKSCGYSPCEGT